MKAGKDLIARVVRGIEESNWDETAIRHSKVLDYLCWIIITASILYFSPVLLRVLAR